MFVVKTLEKLGGDMMSYGQDRLDKALAKAKVICDELHIPYGDIKWIKVNPRLTSSWGYCKRLKTGGYEINIAKFLVDPHTEEDGLMTTVIHELLHSCPKCMCHTGMWKVYANRVTNNTKYNIERCVTAAERDMVPSYKNVQRQREAYKYKVTCLHCGSVFKYKRAGSVVKSLLRKPTHSGCTCPRCMSRDFKVVEL